MFGSKTMFFLGLLVGCFVGWVLGVLSAPQSGQETRETLTNRAVELKQRAEEAAEQVLHRRQAESQA